MYACKVVVTTLDIILILLMFGICADEKNKETVSVFTVIICIIAMNLYCIWR